jgi:hypothetical protein
MKSFSDNVVTKQDVEAVRTELTTYIAQSEATSRKARNWMFGLALVNLLVTIVLVAAVVLH